MKGMHRRAVFILMSVTFFLSVQGALFQTAGAWDNKVVIGLNVPISGSYRDQGKDEEMAYKLAIDRINAEGGVLGKKIEFVLKDTKTDPKVAKQNTVELIRQHATEMVTGGSSRSFALDESDV